MSNNNNWKTVATATLTPTNQRKRKEVYVKVLKIEYELVELSWQSGIQVAREDQTIATPHWQASQPINEADAPDKLQFSTGAKKAGVYLIKGKGAHQLQVKVNVTKSTLSGTGTLKGNLNGLQMEGECPLSQGEHVVTLDIKNIPTSTRQFEGDARWFLSTASLGVKHAPKTTRLEVYFILDNPAPFYKTGVWVEALRFLFRKVQVSGFTKPEEVAKRVTLFCHGEHGMGYDTKKGSQHFDVDGNAYGLFRLRAYILKKKYTKKNNISGGSTVNCYDQAAAVQALTGALGAIMDWYYITPFGYIKLTKLVGESKDTNNPFYQARGSNLEQHGPLSDTIMVSNTETFDDQDNPGKKITTTTTAPMPRRTAFGNHAFVGLAGKIYDACAGPHLGTENLHQYLVGSIDIKATLQHDYFASYIDAGLDRGDFKDTGKSDNNYFKVLESLPNPSTGLTGLEYAL